MDVSIPSLLAYIVHLAITSFELPSADLLPGNYIYLSPIFAQFITVTTDNIRVYYFTETGAPTWRHPAMVARWAVDANPLFAERDYGHVWER